MKKQYYTKYEIKPSRKNPPPAEKPKEPEKSDGFFKLGFFQNKFSDLKADDILLLALIFIMLTEDESDYITIAALCFIFFV